MLWLENPNHSENSHRKYLNRVQSRTKYEKKIIFRIMKVDLKLNLNF